jgi:hypothetical protein
MDDMERGLLFFFTFLFLTIVIGVLGVSVLSRLSKTRMLGRPARGSVPGCSAATAVVVMVLLILGFLSTFLPYVAVLPAVVFAVLGVGTLIKGDRLNRDGGIVLLLVAVLWSVFTAIQADTLASGADIRVDLLITLPVMAFAGFIGWSAFIGLSAARDRG